MIRGRRVGSERFGPYEVLALIGRGGMGEVHRAVDTRKDRRTVALKRLPAGLADDPGFQRRFLREAALAARLRDPHVIPIHDYGEIDGRPYLDMRLVEGTDLATLLARHGPPDPARAVALLTQVARALDAAHHEGLVHRDVKPANVLLATRDETGAWPAGFAYLIDFGIAANMLSSHRSSSVLAGTAAYMAPERFASGGDHRVDVYALTCTLVELLTGRPPFEGDFPQLMAAHTTRPAPRVSERVPGLPRALDDVVAAGMAKDPAWRWPSAGALAAAAERALVPTPVTAPPPVPPPAPPRYAPVPTEPPPRRHRTRLVVGAVVTLVLVWAGLITTVLLTRSDVDGDFVGQWEGVVNSADSERRVVTLEDGRVGEVVGRYDVPGPGCSYALVLTRGGDDGTNETRADRIAGPAERCPGVARLQFSEAIGERLRVDLVAGDTPRWLATLDPA
ncbi:serine/threonine-protein kinase [Actinomycetospora aeridis]|uniref:non-specific serine/threonine protein kinase n=1 Tax=Actinomycetospora aeridis TaxID=3129231 RepID=A0ABU8N371_9PSEU